MGITLTTGGLGSWGLKVCHTRGIPGQSFSLLRSWFLSVALHMTSSCSFGMSQHAWPLLGEVSWSTKSEVPLSFLCFSCSFLPLVRTVTILSLRCVPSAEHSVASAGPVLSTAVFLGYKPRLWGAGARVPADWIREPAKSGR